MNFRFCQLMRVDLSDDHYERERCCPPKKNFFFEVLRKVCRRSPSISYSGGRSDSPVRIQLDGRESPLAERLDGSRPS